MSLCARVLFIVINGVDQAVTGGSLRQKHKLSSKKINESGRNIESIYRCGKSPKKPKWVNMGKNPYFDLILLWSHRFQTKTILN